MPTMRLIVAALIVSTVTACVGPSVVVMKNPTTGEVRQCGNPNGFSMVADSIAARDCAQGFQASGWTRMN